METLFNQAIADSLQYVTFPLELIGLSLALIEVRFPKVAANLTRQIERLSAPIQELRTGQSGSESLIERSLGVLLSRLIKTGLYSLTAIYSIKLIYQLFSRTAEMNWLIGMLLSYVVWAIVMTVALVLLGLLMFFLVVGGSEFSRRFVAGRAIGTLGILIAGLGLFGELYQLLTQIVH
jgi:hypothetical protein